MSWTATAVVKYHALGGVILHPSGETLVEAGSIYHEHCNEAGLLKALKPSMKLADI